MTAKPFFERRGLAMVIAALMILPFVLWAAIQSLASNTNDVRDWFPVHDPDTVDYQWFERHFGHDEFVLITWEGCTLDDPRLPVIEAELASSSIPNAGGARFERVASGSSVLDKLMEPPASLRRQGAIARLTGCLLGADGDQTCVVVWLTEQSRRDLHATLAAIRGILAAQGLPSNAVKLGGPPVVNAAMDEVSAASLNRLIPFTCVVGLVIAWFSIRSLRQTVLITTTAVYSMAASLAALWLCGVRMNGLLITMVPLVYVVATSGAIHLCNYYQQCVRRGGSSGAADRAIAHAMLPLGLATGTTIVGLLSICYNALLPIRLFGFFSAVGVALSWLLQVLWLPASLAIFRWRDVPSAYEMTGKPDTHLVPPVEPPLRPAWHRVADGVIHWRGVILAACGLIAAVGLVGLTRTKISIDVMEEFQPTSALIRDYVWLEQNIGPLVPVEVVLRMNRQTCTLNMLERARLVDRVQRAIDGLEEVGGTISAATFGPDLTRRESSWLRESLLTKRLEANKQTALESGYLAETESEQLWRISARVAALQQVDYGTFVEDVEAEVDKVLHARDGSSHGISVMYTGMAPIFFKARRSLVNGLIWGLGADLVLIVVAITVSMRHWSNGLLLLLTSFFPVISVLGAAGWLGITLDQGAVLAPCVALGVSVDDVIHFLICFRYAVLQGQQQDQAVWLALRSCARPMYQSWTLLGLGMATLSISAFVPIVHFGWTMVTMLSVGLLGNLLLLPALLSGSLGRTIAQAAMKQLR